MSYWTYINGVIKVRSMGRTQHENDYILKTILDHLPRVTGSEDDMHVYINQDAFLNTSSSCDEFGYRTNNLVDGYGDKTRNGWLEYTDSYYLTVSGSLRDRMFDETFREFVKWLCRLSKRLSVEYVLVSVDGYKNGDCHYRTLIDASGYDNPYGNPYDAMYEWPSWANDDDEPAWWEYLWWDRARGSFLPMKLKYKYIEDEENDKAVETLNKYKWGNNGDR